MNPVQGDRLFSIGLKLTGRQIDIYHVLMKKLPIMAVCLVMLALGCTVPNQHQPPTKIEANATVRSVNGNVTYTLDNAIKPVRPNLSLAPGATIATGPNADCWLSVNGVVSAVRLQADTILKILQMDKIARGRRFDTETQIDLKVGSILGRVGKLSTNSSYEFKTPNGIAEIRATNADFGVNVDWQPDGHASVIFTCLEGELVVNAIEPHALEGQPVVFAIEPHAFLVRTNILHTGDSWASAPGQIHPTSPKLINEYESLISSAENLDNGANLVTP